jgi:hypothetical protein
MFADGKQRTEIAVKLLIEAVQALFSLLILHVGFHDLTQNDVHAVGIDFKD